MGGVHACPVGLSPPPCRPRHPGVDDPRRPARRRDALSLPGLMVALPASALAEQAVTLEGSDCRYRDQYPDRRKTIRWSGACVDGWASGPGVLTWFHDGRYEGRADAALADGRIEGRARIAWRDGRRLDGNFKDGLVSGEATHVWRTGAPMRGNGGTIAAPASARSFSRAETGMSASSTATVPPAPASS
nr:hypothetical protein [Azospirillum sp. INR13]